MTFVSIIVMAVLCLVRLGVVRSVNSGIKVDLARLTSGWFGISAL